MAAHTGSLLNAMIGSGIRLGREFNSGSQSSFVNPAPLRFLNDFVGASDGSGMMIPMSGGMIKVAGSSLAMAIGALGNPTVMMSRWLPDEASQFKSWLSYGISWSIGNLPTP
jgi:hypothetical protein